MGESVRGEHKSNDWKVDLKGESVKAQVTSAEFKAVLSKFADGERPTWLAAEASDANA